MAPAMGPIVAGFSVPAKNWHWSLWESLWLSAPIFILLFSLLPETSSDNILLRRAARLRKITGDLKLRSQSEVTMQHMSAKEMTFNALIKPWEMNILDPAIFFTTVYTAVCYAIFYSFFEVFPLIFPEMYGMSPGITGLTFLSVPVVSSVFFENRPLQDGGHETGELSREHGTAQRGGAKKIPFVPSIY